MNSFSLLDEKWIPVEITKDNKEPRSTKEPKIYRDLASLRETLLYPERYSRINTGHPLHNAALYRLHLAILYRALLGPPNKNIAIEWFHQGFPKSHIETYLSRYEHRFNLFGDDPFMQVKELENRSSDNDFVHWTRLSSDKGGNNTSLVFNYPRRNVDYARNDAITPSQAAIELISCHVFSLTGTMRKIFYSAADAPLNNVALFIPIGNNLHQTFSLNLVPYSKEMYENDLPPWEEDPMSLQQLRFIAKNKSTSPAKGYVSRYTWQSRSVLLIPESNNHLICVRNILLDGGKLIDGPGVGEDRNIDPMIALYAGKQNKPYQFIMSRQLWRDIDTILPDIGQSTTSNSKQDVKILPGQPPQTILHARSILKSSTKKTQSNTPLSESKKISSDIRSKSRKSRFAQPFVPILALGQLRSPDNLAKAIGIFEQEFNLPQLFIDDPAEFATHTQKALKASVFIGDALKSSLFLLHQALTVKGVSRDLRKEERRHINKIIENSISQNSYWAHLDFPFRHFLLMLDENVIDALPIWNQALNQSALSSWEIAEEQAGLGSIGLRAIESSKWKLMSALHLLNKDFK